MERIFINEYYDILINNQTYCVHTRFIQPIKSDQGHEVPYINVVH